MTTDYTCPKCKQPAPGQDIKTGLCWFCATPWVGSHLHRP